MKQIVLLITQPLNKRNFDRFELNYFIKRNWKIIIFDLTSLLIKYRYKYSKAEKKNLTIYQIFDFKDLINIPKSFSKPFFYSNQTTILSFFIIFLEYFLIFKGGIKFYFSTRSIMPGELPNLKEKFYLLFRGNFILNLFTKIISSVKNKIVSLMMPSVKIAFISGNIEKKVFSKKVLFIKSQSLDYNLYLKQKKKRNMKFKNYFVFIDQMIPNHPDFKMYKIDKCMDFNDYWKSQKLFLKYLAEKFYLKPIILIHPKNSEKNVKKIKEILNENIFKFQHSNPNLIKNSKFVVMHYSAAFQFAAIFFKKIIFCYHQDFNAFQKHSVFFLARLFGKEPVNIQKFKKNFFLKKINKLKYKKIITDYINSNYTSNISSCKIIENSLNKIIKNENI